MKPRVRRAVLNAVCAGIATILVASCGNQGADPIPSGPGAKNATAADAKRDRKSDEPAAKDPMKEGY